MTETLEYYRSQLERTEKLWDEANNALLALGIREARLRSLNAELLLALKAAESHIEELADAWQRGALQSFDLSGMNGQRSNRNMDTLILIRKAQHAQEKP
jgi:hypothetical protein